MAGRSPDQGFARKKEIWRIPTSLTLQNRQKAGESLRIWRTPLFWRIPKDLANSFFLANPSSGELLRVRITYIRPFLDVKNSQSVTHESRKKTIIAKPQIESKIEQNLKKSETKQFLLFQFPSEKKSNTPFKLF